MLTKERKITTLEIAENNTVIVVERVSIMEDGEEISHSYEQHNVQPGDDYSKEDGRVKAVCETVSKEKAFTDHLTAKQGKEVSEI